MRLYRESNQEILPACMAGACPIEDLATDDEANHFIERFMVAKALARASELPSVQEPIFRELGLLDDEEFHLEMEILYMRHVNRQKQKREGKGWRKF